jgi:glycosyltransferase involved in cell wall biosynthesis
MRIAQIAPLTEAVPPKLYGGTERVVSWLTEELVELGHEVTLFATGDSVTKARLEPMWPRALRLDQSVRDRNVLHMTMIERVCQRAAAFDVLHFHLDYYPFSLMGRQQTPFVTTLHGRLDLPEHQSLFSTFASAPVVSISNAQRKPIRRANWIDTVYNGLPRDLLTPQTTEPSYLAFLGRISPEKGIESAVRIAERCGLELKVAAKVDAVDRDYFNQKVRPLFASSRVDFIGEIADAQKADFLSGAVALIAPIDWPEPFGLVLIEAMACGAPVVVYNRGSVAEIVAEGVSGFIVEDEAGAVAAVAAARGLSRALVRRSFVERFTARRMAEGYLSVYRELIETAQPHPKTFKVVAT